jgi:argininosuccinate lyase
MTNQRNKLWQKDTDVSREIEQFTVGLDRELDIHLAPYDVIGSMAHVRMLEAIGLISREELLILLPALRDIYNEIIKGEFTIEEGVEDVHSQVELLLTRRLGAVGKKIHAGRSRNDQVLLDLKLFMRSEIRTLTEEVKALFEHLQKLSEEHKNVLMPGYTHLQVAMPSSFGLWFGAYAESLADDLAILKGAFDIVNRNPLGSAAGYGSSFPLDRQLTTELLGFESMNYNVIYAQMGRGKAEKILANSFGIFADTLGRFAMDVCLYMGQDFGFLRFPDAYTTGSSIMPHKKNPDVFELIRARSNQLKALPNEISLITANLPTGYHRDLQIIKEHFIPAFASLRSCLHMTRFMLEKVQVNDGLLNQEKYQYLFTVEQVNKLVLQGTPFREAYMEVGRLVEEGLYTPETQVAHTHMGSIGNLATEQVRDRFEKIYTSFSSAFEYIDQQVNDLVKAGNGDV